MGSDTWFVRRALGCALAVLSLGCGGGGGIVDGPVTALLVRGLVEDDVGAPVAGAVVHVAWQPWTCGELADFPPDTTAADGRFAIQAWGWGDFTQACVGVRADPPGDRALQSATVQFDSVRLHPTHGPDTLTVTLTMSPAGG